MTLNEFLFQRSIFLLRSQAKGKSQSSAFRYAFQFRLVLLITFLTAIKMAVHMLTPVNREFEFIVNDIFRPLGPVKPAVSFVFFFWALGTTFSGGYLLRCGQSPTNKLFEWQKLSEVFETSYFHQTGPYHREKKVLHFLLTGEMTLSVLSIIAVCVLSFINTPSKYWISVILFLPFHLTATYATIGCYADFTYLYSFHAYLYGKYFQHEARKLSTNKPTDSLIFDRFLRKNLDVYKEMREAVCFYRPILHNQTVIAFVNQIITLYLIFFVDIVFEFRCAILILSIINLLAAMSFHYFSGSFCRVQVSTIWRCARLTILISRSPAYATS